MPTYRATYALASGREITEEIQSTGPEVVRVLLRQRGVFPIEVDEVASSARLQRLSFPAKTTAWLFRQLGMQIRCGVPEMQAVASLKDSHSSRPVREMLQQVHGALSIARVSFTAALGAFPRVLPPHLRAILAAGEGNGPETMAARLNDVADWLLFQQRIRATIRRSTAYPGLLLLLGSAYLVFFLVWFVPRFKALLAAFNIPLPAYTLAVLGTADWLRSHILLLAAAGVMLMFAFNRIRANDRLALILDRLVLRLPLYAKIYRAIFTTLFAKNYRALLLSGATADEALALCSDMFSNRAARAEIRRLRREMHDAGANLGTALRRSGYLPPEAISAIATAEDTGALPETLRLLAEQYETDANEAVSATLSWIGPALIVCMGVIIGAVLLALFIPMAEFFKYV